MVIDECGVGFKELVNISVNRFLPQILISNFGFVSELTKRATLGSIHTVARAVKPPQKTSDIYTA